MNLHSFAGQFDDEILDEIIADGIATLAEGYESEISCLVDELNDVRDERDALQIGMVLFGTLICVLVAAISILSIVFACK